MSRSHGRSASQTACPILLRLLARRGHGRIGRWSTVLLLTLFLGGSASGQPASKVPHIGWLDFWPNCDTSSLESGLRDLGYVPGTSVVIDCSSAGGRYERLPTAAAELVKLNVDVIVAANQPTARAAHEATETIPIVMIASGDPVAAGLVKNLGHPGGNVTGPTYYATELTAKRLELLREVVPSLSRIGVLANPVVAYLPFENDTLKAASALGLRPLVRHLFDCSIDIRRLADVADHDGSAANIMSGRTKTAPRRSESAEWRCRIACPRWLGASGSPRLAVSWRIPPSIRA